jgi:hypothetical protein
VGSSYPFGLLVSLLASGVTFSGFGWFGLIIGLFISGIVDLPMPINAAFFDMTEPRLGCLLIEMFAIIWVARITGFALISSFQPYFYARLIFTLRRRFGLAGIDYRSVRERVTCELLPFSATANRLSGSSTAEPTSCARNIVAE